MGFFTGQLSGQIAERDVESKEERKLYGDTVKVCNAHPHPDDEGGDADGESVRPGGSSRPGREARTHVSGHSVNWAFIDWPSGYAHAYGDTTHCKYGNVRNSGVHSLRLRPDFHYTTTVMTRWCYRYRSHVDEVQTINCWTTTTTPDTFDQSRYGLQFCGWQPGNPNRVPSVHDDRHEYEVQWHYLHPVAGGYFPWGYGSRVDPWYGNIMEIKRDRYGQITSFKVPCTDQKFRNRTFALADWEGQDTLWASQSD